jgi:hypothetical protein
MSLRVWVSAVQGEEEVLLVSPSGAIAVFTNRVCTIWLDNGRSFDPLYGFIPFAGPISQICWCKGANAHNEVPLYLFLSHS